MNSEIDSFAVRFSQTARKHKIGRGHVLFVMERYDGIELKVPAGLEPRYLWVGVDSRNVELEVIAVLTKDYWLVIHAMPYQFRRGANVN